MRLLFIRHGDPDYDRDGLTETGKKEAELLAEHIEEENIDVIYKSPYGRAQETAAFSEKKLGIEGITYDWLKEFPARVNVTGNEFLQRAYPDASGRLDAWTEPGSWIVWDILPSEMAKDPRYFDSFEWRNSPTAHHSDLNETYDYVMGEFDSLLASYGYERDGYYYRVTKESRKTLAFFCHYGVTTMFLSHLWNVSPFSLFNGIVISPTGVTELVTEERRQGTANFRAVRIGDISHLRRAGQEPSFMARFTDVYSDHTLRH